MKIQKQINEILDIFDFEKVYKTMCFLNWRWGTSHQSPSIQEMKTYVENTLIRLNSELIDKNLESIYSFCGGFYINISRKKKKSKKVFIRVSFVLTDWDTTYN